MEYNKGQIVKLKNGYRCVVIGTPNTFLSGGSYEVEFVDENGSTQRKWVKPEDILYTIDTKNEDDLENYFEFIFDDNGLQIIPKEILDIEIDSNVEELKTITFKMNGDTKHKTITFHIGDIPINFKEEEEEQKEDKKYDLF